MNEVALWDILRPVLIVKKTTGVLYYNQVGGCGCYHKSQEGYLIPLLGIDPMEHRAFNHHVWYVSHHSPVSPNLTGPDIPFPGFNATKEEDMAWHNQKWWDDVVETIEGLRERDTQARDFIRMKVKKDKEIEHYEAWIEVRVLIHTKQHNWSRILKTGVKRADSKEWMDAVLTWQNCD